jgi:hypothetical protein
LSLLVPYVFGVQAIAVENSACVTKLQGDIQEIYKTTEERVVNLEMPVFPRSLESYVVLKKSHVVCVVLGFDITKNGEAINIAVLMPAPKWFARSAVKALEKSVFGYQETGPNLGAVVYTFKFDDRETLRHP